MKKFLKMGLVAVACAASLSSWAASVQARFEVNYESGFFSDSPNEESRKKLMPTAKKEIWKSYVGRQDTATIRVMEQKKGEIEARLDELVNDVQFLDERVDKNAKKMNLVVKGVVNDNLVSTLLVGASGPSGQGSSLGFLILPRLQTEAKSFDAKVVKKASATTSLAQEKVDAEQVKETEGGAAERVIEGDKVTMKASASTSGSTTRKSQKVKWALGDAKDVDSAISKYLTEAGYEPSAYADIASECGKAKTDVVRQDMLASETAELSDDIRREVFDAARQCEVQFFAVGTLDFDSIEEDRNSGGVRARASVNVQVYDLSKRLPRRVASVGPVFYYGVGPREDGARAEAMVTASKEAAQLVVNQLRAKAIQ